MPWRAAAAAVAVAVAGEAAEEACLAAEEAAVTAAEDIVAGQVVAEGTIARRPCRDRQVAHLQRLARPTGPARAQAMATCRPPALGLALELAPAWAAVPLRALVQA
jgi:hypothetical protein